MEDIFDELAAAAASDDEEPVGGNTQEGRADEAEEVNDESRRVVKPKRTVTRAPRPKLDPARLLGPRGIFVLSSTFDSVKFKGKRHELDDLNNILSRLQHWAHRLFPKLTFEDCIERIEELGHKREIQTNMHKLRMGMVDLNGGQEQVADDEEARPASPDPPVDDAFDQLIMTAPAPVKQITLTEEQRARMMRNRLLAEERRMARRLDREKELTTLRNRATSNSETDSTPNNVTLNSIDQGPIIELPNSSTANNISAVRPRGEADDMPESIPTTIPALNSPDRKESIEGVVALNEMASNITDNDVNSDLSSMDVDVNDPQTMNSHNPSS
uniref:TIMELESS-interacting protein n=1 Tax=Lygus hesperus TaxID=30085 RepID=A0A0A9ZHR8_LYGHE